MTPDQSALRTALQDARLYRAALYACLDQLHDAQREAVRLREQLTEMREERARLARTVFAEGITYLTPLV